MSEEKKTKEEQSVAQPAQQPEIKQQPQQKAEEPQINPKQVLYSMPGAPTPEQVEHWKTEFKEVFVSLFSETEGYILRPIFRKEYVELQAQGQDPNPENRIDNFIYQEKVLDSCVLWPKIDWNKAKAGLVETLFEQVMQNSYFITPQMAGMLVTKL